MRSHSSIYGLELILDGGLGGCNASLQLFDEITSAAQYGFLLHQCFSLVLQAVLC